jgi:VCBS repeat-containing protein
MAKATTSTPAKTTAKVATLTGAAKDDLLAGGNEDSTHADLNVLANDPGAARLWSLDQSVPGMTPGSQVPTSLNGVFTLDSGATISANLDGTIHYDGSAVNLQYLAEGEIYTDHFVYTVRMANGALSTASVSVQVVGVNDIAVITGATAGDVMEDGGLTAGGTLVVSDADHDQSEFGAIGSLAGQYGDFLFDSDTGEWSYLLRNADANVQALNTGDVVYDTLDVASLDGTGTATITVTINGRDEPPVAPPDEPEGRTFVVNQGKFVSGHYVIDDFTAGDTLKYAGGLTPVGTPNWAVTDFGNDSVLDTMIYFVQNGNNKLVDVVLIGYTDFAAAQLGLEITVV